MIIDQKPQTSFIPKKPIGEGASIGQASVNFFSIIALSVFLVSLLLAGGLYAYQYYLNQHLVTLQQSLKTAEGQFDPGFINTATRLNARIIAGNQILNAHIAPSFIFSDLLEQYTLQNNIEFTDFTWNYDPAGNGVISMDGVAKDYTSVALQAREFADHISDLKNQIFSNISLDQNGNVEFSFKGSVDASVIDFKDKRAADLSGGAQPDTSVDTSSDTSGNAPVTTAAPVTTTPVPPTDTSVSDASSSLPFPSAN